MALGKSQIDIEHNLRWKLTTGAHPLDRHTADKIASAVAASIVMNNDLIEKQIANLGPDTGSASIEPEHPKIV